MPRKVSHRYLLGGVVLYAVLLVAVHVALEDVELVVSAAGLAAAGLAAAALVTAAVRVREYMDKTDELEEKLNGGLEAAAKTHLQDNEVFESLIVRQDRMEARVEEESKAKEDCQEALTELREWVVGRLDGTGRGRTDGRTNET